MDKSTHPGKPSAEFERRIAERLAELGWDADYRIYPAGEDRWFLGLPATDTKECRIEGTESEIVERAEELIDFVDSHNTLEKLLHHLIESHPGCSVVHDPALDQRDWKSQ